MAYLGPSCLVAFRELFSVHIGTLTPQTSHMTPGRAQALCRNSATLHRCQYYTGAKIQSAKKNARSHIDRHTSLQNIQFRRMQACSTPKRVAPRRAARDTHAALLLTCMAAIPLCSVQITLADFLRAVHNLDTEARSAPTQLERYSCDLSYCCSARLARCANKELSDLGSCYPIAKIRMH